MEQQLIELLFNNFLGPAGSNDLINSTNPDSDGSTSVTEQSVSYFHNIFPMMISLGLGGTLVAFCYQIFNMVVTKIKSKLMTSIEVKSSDDCFKWVSRYMRDKGIVKKGTSLTCAVKKEDEKPWFYEVFKK